MSTKQEGWEEFPEEVTEEMGVNAGQYPTSESGLPRKRRNGSLFSSPSGSPRDLEIKSKSNIPSKLHPNNDMDWSKAICSASIFTLKYLFEVLRLALVVLRKPLSLIFAAYLLAVLVSHLHTTIVTALHPTMAAVAVLCRLPGINRIALCRAPDLLGVAQAGVKQADYPSLVHIQTTSFGHLLDNSIGGTSLALDIKKAEMATVDLTTLVRISHLRSKHRMADTLNAFVEDARRTGRGLQRYSAKVGGAVDRIIAVNDYALKRIEEAASPNLYPSLWTVILSPFSLQSFYLPALTSSFNQAMSLLESELHMLILAAEASIHDLDILEEQLNLIHSMVALEDDSVSASKHELLSKLWTIVGGNRAELRRYETHQSLLSGLTEYRKKALTHVVAALQTLQTTSADLKALRERLSQPVLMASVALPLEVHAKSIRMGLERLLEGRLKAKKIEDAQYAKLSESLSA